MNADEATNLNITICRALSSKQHPAEVDRIGNGEYVCRLYNQILIWSMDDWKKFSIHQPAILTGGAHKIFNELEVKEIVKVEPVQLDDEDTFIKREGKKFTHAEILVKIKSRLKERRA